jgi:hypothetical protein
MPGFGPSAPGTYDIYRRIGSHPTVALARSIVSGPVLTAPWSYERRDDSVPDEWAHCVEGSLEALRPELVRDGIRALDYGWAPFEVVFADSGGRIAVSRIKPLLWDWTEVLVDAEGTVAGVVNRPPGSAPVELLGNKAFVYTYDGEAGNPYGRSRHENIRRRWGESEQICERLAQYLKKVAGLVVQLHYPDGTSKDATGADRPNQWLAQSVLDAVSAGKSVMFPNLFASTDDPRAAAELAGKSQWVLSAFGGAGADHAPGMLAALQYYDALLFRGWLRPERVGLESRHGSRADAAAHTETGAADATLLAQDLARAVNRQIVDPLLEMNFGREARGAVRVSPAPIESNAVGVATSVLQTLLGNPALAADLARLIDVPGLLRDVEIPLAKPA